MATRILQIEVTHGENTCDNCLLQHFQDDEWFMHSCICMKYQELLTLDSNAFSVRCKECLDDEAKQKRDSRMNYIDFEFTTENVTKEVQRIIDFNKDDTESCHCDLDEFISAILLNHGYKDAVDLCSIADKWHA